MIHKNVPLATQVLIDIISGIETGTLVRENGQLPSEGDLCKHFNVSRSTVREALSRLEQRGIVIRQHGIGTFVASQTLVLDTGLEQLESIDTLARRIGLQTQAGESQIVERKATPAELDWLQLSPDSEVLAVSRLILTSGKPIAYLVDVIPTSILRASELENIYKGSILDVFLQRTSPVLSHALTDITVERGNLPTTGNKLNPGGAEIIFKLESLLFSKDGKRIAHSFSYFIPGYFRFHVVRRVNPGEFQYVQNN